MAQREHFTNGRCFAGGSGLALMIAAFGAQTALWNHWITIGVLYGAGIILAILATVWITKSYYSREVIQADHDGSEAMEQTIERYLRARGIAPNTPVEAAPEIKGQRAEPSPPKLDGEIYRIVRADKAAYADLTLKLWDSVNPSKEFQINIDILVEIYLVNTSTETQYIRDFCGSVEIDGVRVPLAREKDFWAFDLLNDHYEYCLDPNPYESNLILEARSETLTPLFVNLPTALAPRQAIEGWVRFLLEKRDPRKLEGNRTFRFTLTDSLGTDHSINRAIDPQKTIPPVKCRVRRT